MKQYLWYSVYRPKSKTWEMMHHTMFAYDLWSSWYVSIALEGHSEDECKAFFNRLTPKQLNDKIKAK
jgi:hypothetical protein